MALPYPTKVVLPFDIATAQDMNERHANDVALSSGTGLNDGAVTPEKRTGGFKVGVIPSSTTSTTGVKSITGLGFSPKLVRFTVLYPASSSAASFSTGSMTSSAQFFAASTGNSRLSGSDAVIVVIPAASASRSLNIEYSSMNADGFSIDVKTALGLEVAYEAYA